MSYTLSGLPSSVAAVECDDINLPEQWQESTSPRINHRSGVGSSTRRRNLTLVIGIRRSKHPNSPTLYAVCANVDSLTIPASKGLPDWMSDPSLLPKRPPGK